VLDVPRDLTTLASPDRARRSGRKRIMASNPVRPWRMRAAES